MWSEILKNGKVRYVERYKDPLTLKDKKISVTMSKDTASNRKAALEELTRKIEAAQFVVKNKNITLQDLYNKYMIWQKQTMKPSTYERNYRTLNRLVKEFGNDSIVDCLTIQYINQKLLDMGVKAGTLNEYIKRFKPMLNWGYTNDLHSNIKLITQLKPFKDVTKREKIKDKYLEPDELSTLLQYMADENRWMWFYITKFMVLSGLRIGELLALKVSDIKNDYIYVTKTYDSINELIGDTKTMTSTRDVYIQPELAQLINVYKHYRKEYCFEHGCKSELLFPNKYGDYINYFSYNDYLKEAARASLKRRVTTHTLRHTHASILAAEGVDIDTISRRLGHSGSKVTKEIYLHITKKLKERDNEQIRMVKIL